MLRVALVHDIVAPYRISLFSQLAGSNEIELTVVFSAETSSTRQWKVERELPFPWIIVPSFELEWGMKERHTWFIPRGLAARLQDLRPDVLVVGGYGTPSSLAAIAWAARRSVPIVLWSETHRERRSGLLRALKGIGVKKVVASCAAFVVPGQMARDYLASLGASIHDIFVSPNTIDTDLFTPKPDRNVERNRIFIPGQLIERKGWIQVLEALRGVEADPPLELVIAGVGPLERTIQEGLAELRVNARFLGHVKYADLPALYCDCNALLFPTQEDIWGFVLQEGAACGLPLIASEAAGATRELMQDGSNGWVVTPDAEGILSGLRSFLDADAERRSRMAHASRNAAERLSVEAATSAFVDAIRHAAT